MMKYMPLTCCSRSICYIRSWSQMGRGGVVLIIWYPQNLCFPQLNWQMKLISDVMFLKIGEIPSHQVIRISHCELTNYGWLWAPYFRTPRMFLLSLNMMEVNFVVVSGMARLRTNRQTQVCCIWSIIFIFRSSIVGYVMMCMVWELHG
jgi:hypothetical protein